MDGYKPWGRHIEAFLIKVLINSLTTSGLLGQLGLFALYEI